MPIFFFHLALATLFTHELDAMVQAEWRLLYVLRAMPDETARPAFIALHVPLFAIILWLVHHPRANVISVSRLALCAFTVLHAGLHYRLSDHPLYTFHSPLSRALIYGAALAGLCYCLLILLSRGSRSF